MPWERAVNSSGCVAFDGTNDYVDISSESTFDLPNYLSVSFWVYRLGSTGFWQPIITKGNGGAANGGFFFALDNRTSGYVEFQIATNSSNILGKEAPLLPGWNHVVGTYDKNEAGTAKLKLYVNGREGGTYYPTGSVTTIGLNNYTLKFGTHEGATTFAKILLDDVRIYNRALTAAEVQSIYRNSSSPPTLGLVCYFPLNEGTGTTVTDSIGGLTGTLTNGPTWQTQVAPRLRPDRDVAPRPKAYSLSFDGTNDCVSIGNVAALDFERTSTFSISAWFKLASTSGRQFLVSKEGHTDPWRGWAVEYNYTGSDNQIQFDLVNSGSLLSSVRTSGQTFSAGVWYHVLATNAGTGVGGMKIYINGVESATTTPYNTLGANTIVNSASVSLGSNNNSALFLNGSLRDARIYNSVLTAADARTLVIGGNPSATPVGKWELNEGTGTTAADTGSGGNNGTLTPNPTGGPTWSTDVPQWWRQDRHTWALSFDGTNDYVNLGIGKINDLLRNASAAAVTLSAWVKYTALDTGQYDNVVFCGRIAGNINTNANLWMSIRGDGANAGKLLVGGRSKTSDSFQDRTSTAVIQANVWTHVACILDFANDKIYTVINGVVESASSVTFGDSSYAVSSFSTGTYYDSIGEQGVAATYPFTGNICDVRLYTSAVSTTNLAKLANNVDPGIATAGYWPLDEGAGTVTLDKSGNGNNGTLSNGPVYTGDIPQWFRRTIESSYAGSFDGINDYINLGSDATIDNLASSDFTVTSWINLSGSPSAGLNYRILDKANSSGLSGWEVYVHDTNRYLAAFVDMGTTDANYISNVSLALSTWYPVAGVWSSSANTFKLYNAAIETTYSASTAGSGTKPDDSANNMSIGALAPLNARYFNGKIDETCIYRRALTAAELADIAAGYLVSAGLISRYKLDGNANDDFGLNHGTEQGGVSYSSAVPATIAKQPRRSMIPFV